MSDLERKIPPFNQDAEMSVLGAVFIDNESLHTALALINTGDFYKEEHRKIYQAMIDLDGGGKPIDLVTICDQLRGRRKGELEEIGGAQYLLALIDYVPTSANIAHYCQIVKDRSLNRKMIEVARELESLGYAEDPGAGELLEQALNKLSIHHKNEPANAPDLLMDAHKRLQVRHDNRGIIQGMPYGLENLDAVTGGIHRGDLVIIAGRPSMGKSALASNVAENVCGASDDAAIMFSLEMSKENIIDRMICSRGRINYSRMRSGQLQDTEWARNMRASEQISRMNLFVDDTPGISLPEIKTKCRKQKRSGLDLVIVDYLQLMKLNDKGNRSQEVGEASRGLKQIARELDVAVVLLSQLNRSVDSRPNKKPAMSDLRDSGEIEQDADVILFPFRPAVYCQKCIDRVDDESHNLQEHMNVAEIIIAKQRNGEANLSLPVLWFGEYQRFDSIG